MQTAPSEAELAALRSEHADRFPRTCPIAGLRGDRGAPVSLTAVVGNLQPDGPAWAEWLRGRLGIAPEGSDLGDRLAAEALLWPSLAGWAAWLQRWPALGHQVAEVVLLKMGAAGNATSDPSPDEQPPGSLAPILDAHPRAVWVRFTPPGEVYDLAVDAPAPLAWRILQKSLKQDGADVAQIIRDTALAHLRGAALEQPEGAREVPPEPLLQRYPGLALRLVGHVGQLAGRSAEVSLGE